MTDVTVVILVPESGDAVQAMKAGLLEIGDVFVINKADRDGADRAVLELESTFALRPGGERPVFRTVATEGQGVPELLEGVVSRVHAARAAGEFNMRRRQVERWRLLQLAQRKLVRSLTIGAEAEAVLDRVTDRVMARRMAPHDAAQELVAAAVKDMNGAQRSGLPGKNRLSDERGREHGS
jgi:LAO/AO transport system kinase